jgi:hypothetical protein
MIARQREPGNWLVDGPAMLCGSGPLPFIVDKFEKMLILFVSILTSFIIMIIIKAG